MRFIEAWSDVIDQNVALKLACSALAVTTIGLGVGVLTLACRAPLIFERGCVTKNLALRPAEAAAANEIEAFLLDVIPERFDSEARVSTGLISLEEMKFREIEQTELHEKKIRTRVIVNKVTFGPGSAITIDSDRLFSTGEVRSVLAFPLKVEVATVERTPLNPYGLILTRVSPLGPAPQKSKNQDGGQ